MLARIDTTGAGRAAKYVFSNHRLPPPPSCPDRKINFEFEPFASYGSFFHYPIVLQLIVLITFLCPTEWSTNNWFPIVMNEIKQTHDFRSLVDKIACIGTLLNDGKRWSWNGLALRAGLIMVSSSAPRSHATTTNNCYARAYLGLFAYSHEMCALS